MGWISLFKLIVLSEQKKKKTFIIIRVISKAQYHISPADAAIYETILVLHLLPASDSGSSPFVPRAGSLKVCMSVTSSFSCNVAEAPADGAANATQLVPHTLVTSHKPTHCHNVCAQF